MLKIFTGILIDGRLVALRKHYFFWFSLMQAAVFMLNAFFSLPLWLFCFSMFLTQVSVVFLDTTLESIMIQQARKDPDFGIQNF